MIEYRSGAGSLCGGSGDDVLSGDLADADELYGGNGDDTFLIDGSDFEVNLGLIVGGVGTDTVQARCSSLGELVISQVEILQGRNLPLFATLTQISAFHALTHLPELDLTGSGGLLDLSWRLEAGAAITVDASALTSGVRLSAGGQADRVTGSSYQDTLYAGLGADTVHGGRGGDLVGGGAGGDRLGGEAGSDTVRGGDGWDRLWGGAGDDWLGGGTGRDHLDGGDGSDRLWGGRGNDTLAGGGGADRLTGGSGADTFRLSAPGGSVATITDFVSADDTVALDHQAFTALAMGALDAAALLVGAGGAGEAAATRLLYDSATGDLRYDADGAGAAAEAVLVARLAPGLALTADDFVVV